MMMMKIVVMRGLALYLGYVCVTERDEGNNFEWDRLVSDFYKRKLADLR